MSDDAVLDSLRKELTFTSTALEFNRNIPTERRELMELRIEELKEEISRKDI